MKPFDDEWYRKAARAEGDHEISAGASPAQPTPEGNQPVTLKGPQDNQGVTLPEARELAEKYGQEVKRAMMERMPPSPITGEYRKFDGSSDFTAKAAFLFGYEAAEKKRSAELMDQLAEEEHLKREIEALRGDKAALGELLNGSEEREGKLEAEIESLKEAGRKMNQFSDEHFARSRQEYERAEALAKELAQVKAQRDRLRDAFRKQISFSHSWVIEEKSAAFIMPVHEAYRKLAQEALEGK